MRRAAYPSRRYEIARPSLLTSRAPSRKAKQGQKMVQESDSDLDLVRLIKEGEQSAFERLVERFQDRVYRLALRISRNPQDAE